MKKTVVCGILVCTLFLMNCGKKEVVGPTGPAGTTGQTGTPGAKGEPGSDGNANVISTNNVTTVNWTAEANNIYTKDLLVPGITQDIVDKGSILVFEQLTSEWQLLPKTFGKNLTVYSFKAGHIYLVNYNTDFSANTNPGAKTYRITIISASN